jgi:hypothetical protein
MADPQRAKGSTISKARCQRGGVASGMERAGRDAHF